MRKERCRRYLAERRGSKDAARHFEGRRIGQVEGLRPELQLIFFSYCEIFEGRKIYVEDAAARNIGQRSGDSAVGEWRRR